jgi:hypothetical protein
VTIKLIIPPNREPVHLDSAKIHCRTPEQDIEDSLISGYISDARIYVETVSQRVIVDRTLEAFLDSFPYNEQLADPYRIELSSPLISVEYVKYIASDGVLTTLGNDVYDVDTVSEPGLVVPAYNQSFPSSRGDKNSVRIKHLAGEVAPITFDHTTDVFTSLGRAFSDDDIVQLENNGGALPSGFSNLTSYFVVSSSGLTFQLSTTSGGVPINSTDSGTGYHFAGQGQGIQFWTLARDAILLLVSHRYEHREIYDNNSVSNIPFSLQSLVYALKP